MFDRRFVLGAHDPDPDVLDLEDAEYLAAWLAFRHDQLHDLQPVPEGHPQAYRPTRSRTGHTA